MTELTEKGKAWKKRVSTKEYREGWDRIFGKAIKKGYENALKKPIPYEEIQIPEEYEKIFQENIGDILA